MLTWFLIGLAALVAILILLRLFVNTDPKVLARGLIWSATILLIGGLATLAFSGRLSWLFVAVPAALPWIARARMLAQLVRLILYFRGTAGTPSGGGPGPQSGPQPGTIMTRDEALKVLGLGPHADETAIRAAHRRLIAALHPDQGGSSYLAAKINQARDVLLSGRK